MRYRWCIIDFPSPLFDTFIDGKLYIFCFSLIVAFLWRFVGIFCGIPCSPAYKSYIYSQIMKEKKLPRVFWPPLSNPHECPLSPHFVIGFKIWINLMTVTSTRINSKDFIKRVSIAYTALQRDRRKMTFFQIKPQFWACMLIQQNLR